MTTNSNCTCGYNIANYFTKCSPKMENGRHTLKEILLGKKPNLNNFILFGCKVFVHVCCEKKY